MSEYVCYCFEHSAEDIHNDIREHSGHSMILEQIITAKQTGGCQCATKHPQGR